MQDRARSSHAIRVLVVEDNIDHALVVRSALAAKLGFHVTHVRTGAEALDLTTRAAFDAFLLDHRLPDWEGVKLCAELRRRAQAAPIIVVASAGQEEVAARAFAAGADDFVLKSPGFADRLADDLPARLARGP